MSDEHLKLVTSFSELRVGMIVVIKRCGQCDGEHRGMLLSPTTYPEYGLCYPRIPTAPCRPAWVIGTGINADTVALKMVYRVDDDLQQVDSESLWQEIKSRRPDGERVR